MHRTESSAQRRRNQGTIALAFISFIVLGIPGGMLGTAWPSIQGTFTLSANDLGVLLLFAQIGYLVASFASGPIALRFGSDNLLVLGAGLRGLGLLGYGLAPNWWAMVAIGLAAGLGGGALDAGLNTIFALRFGARLMNWLHAAFGLGAVLGPLILTGVLLTGVGWRWGYLIAAAAQMLVLLAFLRTRQRWHEEEADAGDEPDVDAGSGRFPHARVWFLLALSVLVFFFTAGIEGATGDWAFSFLTESRGFGVGIAGLLTSGFWTSFTVGRILFGAFADRMSGLLLLRVGMAGAVGAGAIIALSGPNWLVAAALGLMGFALAPLFPLLVVETPRRLGRARAPNAIGIQIGAASIGLALLPGFFGFLAEGRGLETFGPFLVITVATLFLLHEGLVRVSRRAVGK